MKIRKKEVKKFERVRIEDNTRHQRPKYFDLCIVVFYPSRVSSTRMVQYTFVQKGGGVFREYLQKGLKGARENLCENRFMITSHCRIFDQLLRHVGIFAKYQTRAGARTHVHKLWRYPQTIAVHWRPLLWWAWKFKQVCSKIEELHCSFLFVFFWFSLPAKKSTRRWWSFFVLLPLWFFFC